MATLKAKQNAKKAGAVSVTLNHSPLWNAMFERGKQAGSGMRAKADAAADFQRMVAAKEVDVSTDELLSERAKEAASAYDAGQAEALGRAPSQPDSLSVLVSEFKTFIRPEVVAHASEAYKFIGDATKGKTSKEVITDAYQQKLAIHRAIAKAVKDGKPATLTKAQVAEVLTKKGPAVLTAEAVIKALVKEVEAALKAKVKFKPEVKKVLAEVQALKFA